MSSLLTSHPTSGPLNVAYQEALRMTETCMKRSTQDNLVQCFHKLSVLHFASRDRGGDWWTNPSVTRLCDDILSGAAKVREAHSLLMGIDIQDIHEDVARSLTFGIGHRTLCQKVFKQKPLDTSLIGSSCMTELFCLTGPLVEIEDDLGKSKEDSQSSNIEGEEHVEEHVERAAKALHRLCDSEDRIYRSLPQGQEGSEIEAYESEMAFHDMFMGIRDALTCYDNQNPRQQKVTLKDLSFARNPEAENDAKKIFHHSKPGVRERALMAAQMMQSVAMAVGSYDEEHLQYREAFKRLRLARHTYQEVTCRRSVN